MVVEVGDLQLEGQEAEERGEEAVLVDLEAAEGSLYLTVRE